MKGHLYKKIHEGWWIVYKIEGWTNQSEIKLQIGEHIPQDIMYEVIDNGHAEVAFEKEWSVDHDCYYATLYPEAQEEKELSTDVNDMKELIVSQQLTIQSLQKRVDDLQDSKNRREEWLSKAKREAGADIRVSFDDVWKEMLSKPTWEDVRQAIAMGFDWCHNKQIPQDWMIDEFIKQLKQNKK